jgi:hypothetical protein
MNSAEQEQKRLDRDFEKERQALIKSVREVAGSPSGEHVIWEILSMCGLYTTTFTGNSQGAFLEGKRSIGIEILEMLNETDSKFYPNLLLKKSKEK